MKTPPSNKEPLAPDQIGIGCLVWTLIPVAAFSYVVFHFIHKFW